MSVGFKVHFLWYSVGTGSFLHSFFSTISYHLEPNGWGSKYPYLMMHLYNGKIEQKFIPDLQKEVKEIREQLGNYSPNEIIWDIEDLTKQPPWGDNISSHITSLANYFVTNQGEDLFNVLLKAIEDAIEYKNDLEVKSLGS